MPAGTSTPATYIRDNTMPILQAHLYKKVHMHAHLYKRS